MVDTGLDSFDSVSDPSSVLKLKALITTLPSTDEITHEINDFLMNDTHTQESECLNIYCDASMVPPKRITFRQVGCFHVVKIISKLNVLLLTNTIEISIKCFPSILWRKMNGSYITI